MVQQSVGNTLTTLDHRLKLCSNERVSVRMIGGLLGDYLGDYLGINTYRPALYR